MKAQTSGDTKLASEIQKALPARLSVSHVHSRESAGKATGTLRIYCSADRKAFLSDFEARLDSHGRVTKLMLDGLDVKAKGFCADQGE